jgi:hypothetical protein
MVIAEQIRIIFRWPAVRLKNMNHLERLPMNIPNNLQDADSFNMGYVWQLMKLLTHKAFPFLFFLLCSRSPLILTSLMRKANWIYPFLHPTLARKHRFRPKELVFSIVELIIWDWRLEITDSHHS